MYFWEVYLYVAKHRIYLYLRNIPESTSLMCYWFYAGNGSKLGHHIYPSSACLLYVRKLKLTIIWWCHQMEKNSVLLALCAGNSPVTGEFPSQRPVTRSFDIFFDLRLNKLLIKQWRGWWFETPSRSLCHHCNEYAYRYPSSSRW